jgi:PEGA domain
MNDKNDFIASLLLAFFLFTCAAFAQSTGEMVKVPSEKARIFITDSQSWELGGGGGGSSAGFGGAGGGGARPQTAEIIKTFSERCPDVTPNDIKAKADYIVILDHEGGKSSFLHRNKVAVFTRVTGDSIVSKSTYSLGASVQEACNAIRKDWAKNSDAIRSAEATEAAAKQKPVAAAMSAAAESAVTRVTVASVPIGADIEVDGNFVGNTPSTINLPAGDHAVTVSKSGYKTWERKMQSNGGNVNLNVELEAQQEAQK